MWNIILLIPVNYWRHNLPVVVLNLFQDLCKITEILNQVQN